MRSLSFSCISRCLEGEASVLTDLYDIVDSALAENSEDAQLIANALQLGAIAAKIWIERGECQSLSENSLPLASRQRAPDSYDRYLAGDNHPAVERVVSAILTKLRDNDPLCQKGALEALKVRSSKSFEAARCVESDSDTVYSSRGDETLFH